MTHVVTRATRSSRIAGSAALILLAALAAAPWWATSAQLLLMGEFLIYLALACLWNLLAGYAGLVSVGQQAYVGLGGYAMVRLVEAGLPPFPAIFIAALLTGIIACSGVTDIVFVPWAAEEHAAYVAAHPASQEIFRSPRFSQLETEGD